MIPFIDLTRQHAALRDELLAATARVFDSSQFVLGAEGAALEQELAALCGVRFAIGVASGTDALRLALTALYDRCESGARTLSIRVFSPF